MFFFGKELRKARKRRRLYGNLIIISDSQKLLVKKRRGRKKHSGVVPAKQPSFSSLLPVYYAPCDVWASIAEHDTKKAL